MIIKETFPHFFLAYILFEACLKRASLQKVSTSHLHVSALICSSNKPVTWNAHQVFHRISPHQPLIGWRHLSVGKKEKKKKKETCQCIKHLLLQQLQVHHQAALSGGDVTALTVGTDKIHCVSRWAADWMSEYEPWRSADVTWFGPNACGRRFHLLTGIRCSEGVVFLL